LTIPNLSDDDKRTVSGHQRVIKPQKALKRIRRLARGFLRRKEVEKATPSLASPVPDDDIPRIVISLTSHGSRLNTVHLTIKSLMMQSVQPDKIILYLDKDSDDMALPTELVNLEQNGLTVRRGCENIGPHLKYFHALREFNDSSVITVDDDAIYTADLVESLLTTSRRFPQCAVARRVHRIRFYPDGDPLPYNSWIWEWQEDNPHPRNSLLALGVGGVLYPPHIWDKIPNNGSLLRRLALHADDLWLKALEITNGIPVVYAPNTQNHPFLLNGTQDEGLFQTNVLQDKNDAVFSNLLSHFGLSMADFADSADSDV
jgi:hypothetical protein